MATYGRGQMLGSGINPESFKQDYSGFARAAEMQAQGMSNLGASIGGVIKDFGDAKKEQKKVDAYNKASVKAIEAAITLGGSYGITGAEETLRPFLEAYNDPNLSPIEKAALLDEGKGMIPNVFGRFDASQADAIQRAQIDARNAPPMPEQFGFTGSELKKTDKGDIYVFKGNDGLDYDPKTKLPIFDLDAFGEGLPPEVWSGGSTFSDDQGGITTPSAFLPGENPSDAIDYANSLTGNMQGSGFPTNLNVARPTPSLSPSQIESAASLSSNPLLGTRSGDNSDLPAIEAANQAALKPRYITGKEKAEAAQEPVTITMEKLRELMAVGVRPKGTLNPDGTFSVTDFNTGSLPQGMTVEVGSDGQIKLTQGAGVGAKEEKVKRTAEFQETRQTNFIIDKANEAEEIIDNSISIYGGGTLIDMAKSAIPGTQEYKLKNQIFPALKDSIALDAIKQLKAASPTGSTGLGAVTEKEGQRLENMYGVLDIGGDKVTLKNDIKRLKQTAFDYIHGSKDERKKALAEGKITKDQNDQVEQMYKEQILGVSGAKAPARSGEIRPNEQELIDKYRTK